MLFGEIVTTSERASFLALSANNANNPATNATNGRRRSET